jgi:hypothetical protein
MNRAFISLTILAVLILLGGRTIAKTQKPSEEMILILIHHKSGPNDLDEKGLPDDKAKEIPSKAEMLEYEVYNVPALGAADEFEYHVYLHIKSSRYWIRRWGGQGGVTNFYGPGLVEDLRK